MEKEISVFLEKGEYYFCIDGYQVEFLDIINLLNNIQLETKIECTFENPICVCEIYLRDDTDGGEGNSSFLSIGLKLIEYDRKKITTEEDITVRVNKDENNNGSYDIVSNLRTQENISCNNILLEILKIIEGIFQAHPKQDDALPPHRAIEEVASSTPDFVEGARDIDECAREVAEENASAGFKV